MNTKKPVITVVGSANVDYIMQVPHLPSVGETVMDATFDRAFGGKGANQAIAAVRAGASVNFVAALGHDAIANEYLTSLKNDHINTEYVSLENDFPGGAALIMFDAQGENYLSVALGANSSITANRVHEAEAIIQAADYIILQQEIPLGGNLTVLDLAERHGIPVLLNYAPATDLSLKPDARVHGLILNETEAIALAKRPFDVSNTIQAEAIATELLNTGAHTFVVVTLGRHGLAYADASGSAARSAFQVNAVDTTAAGDTFCGVLAVMLGEGHPLPAAIESAAAASALAVTKVGAQSSIPTRNEINQFLQKQNEPN